MTLGNESFANPYPDSYADQYAELNPDELLRLARDYDSLNDAAQTALRAEFARREMQPPLVDESEDVSVKLVTIRHYRDLSEAIVARSLLESSGMRVELRDENLVRLDWQWSNFIGGIRLQVEETDEAAATALLDEPVPETIEFAGPFDSSNPEYSQPHCPRCGSLEIVFEGATQSAAYASLYLFALPLPQGPKAWSCRACGARWEDTEA
jgi:hypothetical protein